MILLSNAAVLDETAPGGVQRGCYIAIDGATIHSVGSVRPQGTFPTVIDCTDKLVMPGLYNAHSHLAMTLLRGYGEQLPLQRWLRERIFPAEERLKPEFVYAASQLGIAEMLRSGTVSFSDMYFFEEQTARAVEETGIKANLSRSCVCFDEAGVQDEGRLQEAQTLYRQFHNSANGRLKVDFSVHAVYTTTEAYLKRFAETASGYDTVMQVHVSETEQEVKDCFARSGCSPVELLFRTGIFSVPSIAAHGVWLSEADRQILAKQKVTVAHNPVSNLKLGSGIADVPALLRAGVAVALGTDGCASNNSLDLFEEMKVAALLPKGVQRDPTALTVQQVLHMTTKAGAAAQRRPDCGRIDSGYKADLIALDLCEPNLNPGYDACFDIVYSAQGGNVWMTMVDGNVLYRAGTYHTLDLERVRFEAKAAARQMWGE